MALLPTDVLGIYTTNSKVWV